MDNNEFEIVSDKNTPSNDGDGNNFYMVEPNKKTKEMKIEPFKVLKTKEEQPTLPEAQEFVQGTVELVRLEDHAQMLVNENGLQQNPSFEVNYAASFIAGFTIVGPALILEGEAKWD